MEKVVIIGAGPAGLTGGLELLSDGNKNYDVVNHPDKFQLYIDGKEVEE